CRPSLHSSPDGGPRASSLFPYSTLFRSRYRCDDKPLPCLYISDEDALREAQHLVIATRWVRDLVNTPAADMMPEHLAAAAETIADRKSTRLNSSHVKISYAVFCLEKKTP